MKKTIIVSILAFIIIVVISIFIFMYSKKAVTFTLEGSGYTVEITTEKGGTITQLESSGDVSLRKGNYLYRVIGEGYDAKVEPFTVDGDVKITVNPQYLESYLPKLIEKERDAVLSTLTKKYPKVGTITIDKLSIDTSAKWAYGTLYINSNASDLYRFIMKKDKSSWTTAITPSIAINKNDIQNIPEDIIYSLY